jgi:hypothetical protein
MVSIFRLDINSQCMNSLVFNMANLKDRLFDDIHEMISHVSRLYWRREEKKNFETLTNSKKRLSFVRRGGHPFCELVDEKFFSERLQ